MARSLSRRPRSMVQRAASLGAEDTRELRDAGCGRQVGRYTLLRRIAAGGMAEVFSAKSTAEAGLAKKVAIKQILPQYSHNERFISMLLDEAKITVALDHPNIAQVQELGRDGEDYFIVMEYVDGRPLNKLMQRVDERGLGVIPVEHACHIMGQVALGLHHAHDQVDAQGNNRNIVHRDVSPQNVLLSYGGPVKLIDFGIARAEGRLNQTSAGVIKGKLRYLAPEIAAGMEPDSRADIFCCGIVLFEMLTGEAMFAPKSDLEAIELATQAKVKSPRARNRRVPQDLDDIVMKALQKDRAHRYQTARELHADLRRFLAQAYPAFVDSDLGDFMQDMFAVEIREDRRKDELAERIAAEVALEPAAAPEPTVALPMPEMTSGQTGYQQLVTRVAIHGADGGDAMDVVPADTDARPLIAPGSGDPATLPPQEGPGAALAAAEPTVKAANPFVTDAPSGLPTLGDVTPTNTPLRTRNVSASDAVLEPLETIAASDPSLTPAQDVTRLDTERGLDRRKWPLWVGGGALLASVIAAVVMLGGEDTPTPVPIPPAPIELDPIPIEQTTGAFRIEVSPVVPISVTVAGTKRADRMLPPIVVRGIAPGVPQTIGLSADGFRSITITRQVDKGETLPLALELVAATATIEVEGMRSGYAIESSHGEVEGHRIVGIPADTTVEVRVRRPGTKDFRASLDITEPVPVQLTVPKPKARPRGTLVVHTRPVSTVFVDGKKRGRTPLKLRLPSGPHSVVLKGPGGRQYKTTRKVRPGRVTRFQFQW